MNTYNYNRYSPLTVNIPELPLVPRKFSASQVKIPALDDRVFKIVNKFEISVSFTVLDTLYLLVSDTFIIVPSKYQMMVGTGSPMA